MATITTHICDICHQPAKFLKARVPVVFVTEQTEGRPCKPNLVFETVDICEGCLQRVVDSYPLTAHGAQGHNTYVWR
jgi:hypothetical protein